MARIFISYDREDGSEVAKELANRLKGNHQITQDAYYAPDNIDWLEELGRQISRADLVLLIMTPNAAFSRSVFQEIMQAQEAKKVIIPVRVEGTPLPPYLLQSSPLAFDGEFYEPLLLEIERSIVQLQYGIRPSPQEDTKTDAGFSSILLLIAGVLIGAVIVGGVLWAIIGGQSVPTLTGVATVVSLPTVDVSPLPETTDTPTDLPTPTDEPSATSEPTATDTPMPPTATEAPAVAYVNIASGATLRSEPSDSNDARVGIVENQRLPITGRTADEQYYRVIYESQEFWIRNSVLIEIDGDVSQVPVIESAAEPTPTPDDSLLLFEDFEDGEAQDWQVYSGNFEIIETSDENQVWQAAGYALYILPLEIYDYAFEAEMKQVSSTSRPAQAHLNVRVEPGTNCYRSYSLYIDVFYQLLSLYETDYSCERAEQGVEGFYGNSLSHDTWYTLKIIAEGAEIRAYLDDFPIMSAESNSLQSNIVAISVDGVNPSFYIDDIRVWSLE